jgi:hypothetical protein
MNDFPVNPTLCFDVYVTSSHKDHDPDEREFFVRVPARHLAEVLDMHAEGVARVMRELISEGMDESAVYHNGRGRFADVTHFVRWCAR